MKMSLFTQLETKYESSIWLRNPELGLFDTLLESHPELLDLVKDDIMSPPFPTPFERKK